jgi:surface protein
MKGNKFQILNENKKKNKNLNTFSKKRNPQKKLYFQLLIISLVIISLIQINGQYELNISIIIRGVGFQKIIHDKYNSSLSKVYINSKEQNEIQNIYNFTLFENNVTMVFNNIISCCDNMFKDLENIIQIDLSKFHNYNNTNMESMFLNCKNLTSINFGFFKTNKVTNMLNVFANCTSLQSLNLENFDTTQVTTMENMFWYCRSLI